MNVAYRAPKTDDLAFIMATWLNGQRIQGDNRYLNNYAYFRWQKHRIAATLTRSLVTVICNPNDESQILGFLVYRQVDELFIIHYAHMKKPYRRLGIMSALIRKLFPKAGRDEIAITHINGTVAEFKRRHRLKFNPFIEGFL